MAAGLELETSSCPPEGARFFRDVSKRAIVEIECVNPFKGIKIFDLTGVDKHPLSQEQVPPAYRPYQGCLFDVLGEPDGEKRFRDLCSFFCTLGCSGDKGHQCGLLYTVMHVWTVIHQPRRGSGHVDLPKAIALLEYFVDAGVVEFFLRVLTYSSDPKFLLTEYNRYVPYRVLECLRTCTHGDQPLNKAVVQRIIERGQIVVETFLWVLKGGVSALEQMMCCQVMGNMSGYALGVSWLLDHPRLCGAAGRQLWTAYSTQYATFRQHQDLQSVYQRSLYEPYLLDPPAGDGGGDITRLPQDTTHLALTLVTNVCAAHLQDTPLSQIEPSVLAIVEEGLHDHLGNVMCGILLSCDDLPELTPEKFLSFVSWSVFQPQCQQLVMKQLTCLPHTRRDRPLFFSRLSFSKRRSVLSFLLTHALWMDEDNGALSALMGVVSLLKGNHDVAMEMIRLAGDLLFDLAHSLHQVELPYLGHPLPVKRVIFELFLELGGYSFYNLSGDRVTPKKSQFEEPVPQCIKDVKEFCERYVKEKVLPDKEKQRLVRCADSFKTEGNEYFRKEQFQEAIVCYTKALDTCPLISTGRRVTYYSNRAECYLKTHQPRCAIRDCNRAIAQSPSTFNARWRRAQALQMIGANHFAALDYYTITHRDDTTVCDLLGPERLVELKREPAKLLEDNFSEMAEKELGPTVYRGFLERDYGVRVHTLTPASTIPPHTGGQAYHQIFRMDEGVHISHGL